MANGIYITRSLSFPDPTVLADAVARARQLGVSLSKYVVLLIEKDLAENKEPLTVRDLVKSQAATKPPAPAPPAPAPPPPAPATPHSRDRTQRPAKDWMDSIDPKVASVARDGALVAVRLARRMAAEKAAAAATTARKPRLKS